MLNDADMVNLNVEVAVSGATVTRGDMGGEPLDGWPISVMMGEGDDAEAVEGAPDMLDDMGMASFEYAVGADALPAMFSFAVTEEAVDGEKIASEAVDYTHTGLSMAGGEVALEASFATQTLMAYVHHERDQVAGYTGEALLGGDQRVSKMVVVDVLQISSSGRAVKFDDADGVKTKQGTGDDAGVWTFSNVPAAAKVLVIATPAEDSNVRIIGDDEVAAYGDDANVTGGLFGENGGWSSTVEVPSFAFVHTYAVKGQVWKRGVEIPEFGDGFDVDGDDEVTTVSGISVSLDYVEGSNLAEESASAETVEKNDPKTTIDERKYFDFDRMAAGAYQLAVSSGWKANLPKLFDLSDVADDDDNVNIDVTPATGIVYGRVMGKADGLPLAGVQVNVNGVDAADVTDRHGRYIVEGFGNKKNKTKDAVFVTLSYKGEVDEQDPMNREFKANTPGMLDLTFQGGAQVATISGKITAAGSDKGLAGVEITLMQGTTVLKPNNANAKSRSTLDDNDIYKTGADGTYSVEVEAPTAPESITVTVTPDFDEMTFTPPFHTVAVSAGIPAPSRHFTAFEYGTITGLIRGEDKNGVRYIKVEAQRDGVAASCKTCSDITGSTGAFSLRVPHGTYDISLPPPTSGYTFKRIDTDVTQVSDVTVAPGENRSLGTITAVRNGQAVAPVFTSATTFRVPEYEKEIGKVTAVDPANSGATITFAEGTGTDQSLFTVSETTGVLTWTEDPERYTAGNKYELEVTANSSAGGSHTQDITVTITNVAEHVVTFNFDPDEISERGETSKLTATVNTAFDKTVFVKVMFSNDDGDNFLSDDDLDGAGGDDIKVDGTRTLIFVRGSTKSENSLTITSINDDDPGDVTIQATSVEATFEADNGFIPIEFKADDLTIESDDTGDSGS